MIEIKYPNVRVKLRGRDGNAFSILGACGHAESGSTSGDSQFIKETAMTANPRPRKPGLTPESTWIIEEEGDETDPLQPEDEPPPEVDPLEFLEPECPPVHDAVFFSLAPMDGPLQLDDLRTGRSVGTFSSLKDARIEAAKRGLTRGFGVRVLRRGA